MMSKNVQQYSAHQNVYIRSSAPDQIQRFFFFPEIRVLRRARRGGKK